ncbi:hypothetical protein HNQ91_001497 [Filimonas zeae]|uniref:Uncharacterized protein n=1 Tax=Filimonas zeae TaxID=1737353 RepID=A0A917J004_9BACT|nr:hypothetical protein [Filimonas zeae]MDR6338446.1 hypothetical protein [Filimonas zeae]GGH68224.1 hypothetical protein GCM10011379_24310 [Filimonas zeae]
MNNPQLDMHSKAGVTGGMAFTMLSVINSADVWKTVILAAIGATVSFLVSLLLKWIARRRSR